MTADDDVIWDAPLIMGVAYTLLYGFMVFGLMIVDIPDSNQKTVDILAGAMTVIQTAIVTYFFGATRSAERSQRVAAESKAKTDTVLLDLATTTPDLKQKAEPVPVVLKTGAGVDTPIPTKEAP